MKRVKPIKNTIFIKTMKHTHTDLDNIVIIDCEVYPNYFLICVQKMTDGKTISKPTITEGDGSNKSICDRLRGLTSYCR
jgi:hypothetical protein